MLKLITFFFKHRNIKRDFTYLSAATTNASLLLFSPACSTD